MALPLDPVLEHHARGELLAVDESMPHRLGQHEALGLLRRHRAPRRPPGVAALDKPSQQRFGRLDPPLHLLPVADPDGPPPFSPSPPPTTPPTPPPPPPPPPP